jgi:virginiamycin B lyase
MASLRRLPVFAALGWPLVLAIVGCGGGGSTPAAPNAPLSAGGTDATRMSTGQPLTFRQIEPDATCPLGRITIFAGPAGGGGGVNITSGLAGDLWYPDHGLNSIVKLTKKGVGTSFTIPTSGAAPEGIALGPNKHMWFTEWNQDKIGDVSATGTFREFTIKPPSQSPSKSVVMIQGPDKRIWFGTDFNGIGVHKVGGKTVFYNTQINSEQIIGLTVGPDRNVWYTTSSGPHIGKITKAGVPTNYDVGASGGFGLSAGPDGRIWFADAGNSRIGAINTDGTGLTYYSAGLAGQPYNIVKAPDGNLYFTTAPSQQIGRITTSGVITECPITAPQPFVALGITIGTDGKVWFVDNTHAQVGRLAIP